MKYKVIALAVFAVIVYSCASTSSLPVTEVKKEEAKVIVVTSELAEGQNLYENNCANCHKLYDTKDFSAEEWKPIVARMQKNAQLNDMEAQKIYNYLTMN